MLCSSVQGALRPGSLAEGCCTLDPRLSGYTQGQCPKQGRCTSGLPGRTAGRIVQGRSFVREHSSPRFQIKPLIPIKVPHLPQYNSGLPARKTHRSPLGFRYAAIVVWTRQRFAISGQDPRVRSGHGVRAESAGRPATPDRGGLSGGGPVEQSLRCQTHLRHLEIATCCSGMICARASVFLGRVYSLNEPVWVVQRVGYIDVASRGGFEVNGQQSRNPERETTSRQANCESAAWRRESICPVGSGSTVVRSMNWENATQMTISN